MVDAVRCAMSVKRNLLSRHDSKQFLLKLWKWHEGLKTRASNRDEFLLWSKLRTFNPNERCFYMEYDKTTWNITDFCNNPVANGWAWCSKHKPSEVGLVKDYHRTLDLSEVPDTVYSIHDRGTLSLGAVGYFENHWADTKWRCSFQNLLMQLQKHKIKDSNVCMGMVRFHGFFYKEARVQVYTENLLFILERLSQNSTWDHMTSMDTLVIHMWELNPDTQLWSPQVQETTVKVLEWLPMFEWPLAMTIVFRNICTHLVISTYMFADRKHFVKAMERFKQNIDINFAPLVRMVLDSLEHIEWLQDEAFQTLLLSSLHIVFPTSARSLEPRWMTPLLRRPPTRSQCKWKTELETQMPAADGTLFLLSGCDLYLTLPVVQGHLQTDAMQNQNTGMVVYADPALRPILDKQGYQPVTLNVRTASVKVSPPVQLPGRQTVMYSLPVFGGVRILGSFHHKKTTWTGAFQELQTELRDRKNAGAVGILRFHNILYRLNTDALDAVRSHTSEVRGILNALTNNHTWDCMAPLDALVIEIVSPSLRYTDDVRGLVETIVEHAPLFRWRFAAVVVMGRYTHLVVNTSVFHGNRESFVGYMQTVNRESRVEQVPVLCIVLNSMEHAEWLQDDVFRTMHIGRRFVLHVIFPSGTVQSEHIASIVRHLVRDVKVPITSPVHLLDVDNESVFTIRGCHLYLTFAVRGNSHHTLQDGGRIVFIDERMKLEGPWTPTNASIALTNLKASVVLPKVMYTVPARPLRMHLLASFHDEDAPYFQSAFQMLHRHTTAKEHISGAGVLRFKWRPSPRGEWKIPAHTINETLDRIKINRVWRDLSMDGMMVNVDVDGAEPDQRLFERPDVREITRVIVQHVPLYQWPVSMVTVLGFCTHLILNTGSFINAKDFHASMDAFATNTQHIPLQQTMLCIVLERMDHMQWVNTMPKNGKSPLHLVFPPDNTVLSEHLVDLVVQHPTGRRPNRLIRGIIPLATPQAPSPETQLPMKNGKSLFLMSGCDLYLTPPHTEAPPQSAWRNRRTGMVVYADPQVQKALSIVDWSVDRSAMAVRVI